MGLGLALSSCSLPTQAPVLVLQPFRGLPSSFSDSVRAQLARHKLVVMQRRPLSLPARAYYAPRHRYRADSLLRFLARLHQPDTVVVGLTHRDISTTKNGRLDWGVLGLGYQPGRACVVFSYRLRPSRRASQFYKVVLHEIGHTQGLAHCPRLTCYMRDAAGGNPTDAETGFCASCAAHLRQRGWQLPPAKAAAVVLPKTP